MSLALALVLLLLLAAIVMFAIDRPRMDAVALIVLTLLPFVSVITGENVVSMNEALAGFSDGNIVLIAALFVIGDGLVRTGVARQLGDWLNRAAGTSESRLIVLLMLVVCGLGSTMSSTAVTAIFIPVVLRIARTTGTSPSKLMMPLSAAALMSGMMTLVATAPNLVVNSELETYLKSAHAQANSHWGQTGFGFFSFTPFGLPILALGIVYMLFARRWLPDGASSDALGKTAGLPSLAEWVKRYRLTDREHRVRILPESPLVGRSIEEIRLRDRSGASLVAIERERKVIQPTAKTVLEAGDILLIDLFAAGGDADTFRQEYALERLPLSGTYFTDRSQEIGMAEAIVPAESDLIGRTVAESNFRSRFSVTIIGLRRGVEAHEGALHNEKLQLGDTLLVIGPWKSIKNLQSGRKHVVPISLPAEMADVLPVAGKAPQAVACLALVVGLMVSGVIPNVQAALIGCLLMGALGVVNLTSAYRAIDWKTIILIVGMLPFSIALQRTGGVELAADGLTSVTSGLGPRGVLAALFAITALLGMFISNTATAVLMAPVAIAISQELGFSPFPFAMIVALAASTAFMTPVSSPVNTLVVTPGNYRFGDFVRVGVPFSILVLIVCVALVPILLPLEPPPAASP
jgi:di/tricarboxylate transporter